MKTSLPSNYQKPLTLAVAFHLLLLVFFFFRWNSNDTTKMPSSSSEIVQATLVSSLPAAHSPPVPMTPALPAEKPIEIPPKPPALKPEPLPVPKKPVPMEQIPVDKDLPHPSKPDPLPVLDTPSESEKKVALEKEKQAAKKQAEKKALLEKQQVQEKQQEQEKQKKLQADMQRQLEDEQKQKKIKEAKQQQKEIEQLLQKDLADTHPAKTSASKNNASTKVANAASGVDNKEIDRYKGLIISAISHHWIVPEKIKKGLECHLRVRVAPGGVVMAVKQIKSSGDAALDRSAESAVYKASPLPVPKEGTLFNEFREFNLVVRPEGILTE